MQTSNYHNKYNGDCSNQFGGGYQKQSNGFQSKSKSNIWKTYSQQKAQDPNAHKMLFDMHNNGNINIQNYNSYLNQNSAVKM